MCTEFQQSAMHTLPNWPISLLYKSEIATPRKIVEKIQLGSEVSRMQRTALNQKIQGCGSKVGMS